MEKWRMSQKIFIFCMMTTYVSGQDDDNSNEYEYNYESYEYFEQCNPGEMRTRPDCQVEVCVASGEWELAGLIDPKCCSYNNNYDYNEYNDYDDYFGGSVDRDRTHAHTSWANLKQQQDDYYEYYNSLQWYMPGEKRTRPDCQVAVCGANGEWKLAGLIDLKCIGCEFNGQKYRDLDRLPGCLQVYCIQGYWVQEGYIDANCSECYALWDPHMKTFDGYNYDYHGTSDFALAQIGTSENPNYGIFSEFFSCWRNGACVGPSTYMDSPSSVIKMGVDGMYTPDLYMLYVNGESFEIQDNVPRLVKEGTLEHPVFAWRYSSNCIRLLGSSGLAVEKCNYHLKIWASSDFMNTLYGLCGFFDGDVNNDFANRDGSQSLLEKYPNGIEFPSSWEASGSVKRDISEDASGNCTLDDVTETTLRTKCNETISAAGDAVMQEELVVLIENCLYDLCTISKNTSGNSSAIESWLGNVQASVEIINDVAIKTTDEDVLPEQLFDGETAISTTTTTTTESPTTEDKHPHPPESYLSIHFNLKMKLRSHERKP